MAAIRPVFRPSTGRETKSGSIPNAPYDPEKGFAPVTQTMLAEVILELRTAEQKANRHLGKIVLRRKIRRT